MSGNVWEWVQDVFHPELRGGEDPLYEGHGDSRSLRGGSWLNDPRNLRLGGRHNAPLHTRYNFIGLRLAENL